MSAATFPWPQDTPQSTDSPPIPPRPVLAKKFLTSPLGKGKIHRLDAQKILRDYLPSGEAKNFVSWVRRQLKNCLPELVNEAAQKLGWSSGAGGSGQKKTYFTTSRTRSRIQVAQRITGLINLTGICTASQPYLVGSQSPDTTPIMSVRTLNYAVKDLCEAGILKLSSETTITRHGEYRTYNTYHLGWRIIAKIIEKLATPNWANNQNSRYWVLMKWWFMTLDQFPEAVEQTSGISSIKGRQLDWAAIFAAKNLSIETNNIRTFEQPNTAPPPTPKTGGENKQPTAPSLGSKLPKPNDFPGGGAAAVTPPAAPPLNAGAAKLAEMLSKSKLALRTAPPEPIPAPVPTQPITLRRVIADPIRLREPLAQPSRSRNRGTGTKIKRKKFHPRLEYCALYCVLEILGFFDLERGKAALEVKKYLEAHPSTKKKGKKTALLDAKAITTLIIYPPSYVRKKLEFLAEHPPGMVHNPLGWLFRALQFDWKPAPPRCVYADDYRSPVPKSIAPKGGSRHQEPEFLQPILGTEELNFELVGHVSDAQAAKAHIAQQKPVCRTASRKRTVSPVQTDLFTHPPTYLSTGDVL